MGIETGIVSAIADIVVAFENGDTCTLIGVLFVGVETVEVDVYEVGDVVYVVEWMGMGEVVERGAIGSIEDAVQSSSDVRLSQGSKGSPAPTRPLRGYHLKTIFNDVNDYVEKERVPF